MKSYIGTRCRSYVT